MRGDADLSPLERRQKQTGLPSDGFGDEVLFLAFELDRLLDDCTRNLQERRRCLNEFIMIDRTVAIFGKLLQDMPDACLRTNHRIPWNAESLRQAIRGLETLSLIHI